MEGAITEVCMIQKEKKKKKEMYSRENGEHRAG
jgi:hypothetical protein